MRSMTIEFGARLIDKDGFVRSFSYGPEDWDILEKEKDGNDLVFQYVEHATCQGFNADDAIRMTIKNPDCSFSMWDWLDPADYSDVIGNAEGFADYIRQGVIGPFDFYCQRILSDDEARLFEATGKFFFLISDDIDDIVLPKRDFDSEKEEFIRSIEEKNAHVKKLKVRDLTITDCRDFSRKEYGRYMVRYREITFLYFKKKYSAIYNLNARILKPVGSSFDLSITTFEEDEDFDRSGYQPIFEAFYLDKYIPITEGVRNMIEHFQSGNGVEGKYRKD